MTAKIPSVSLFLANRYVSVLIILLAEAGFWLQVQYDVTLLALEQSGPNCLIKGTFRAACLKGALRPLRAPIKNLSGLHGHDLKTIRTAIFYLATKIPHK
ncbi:hypothetical protein FQA47_010075 [Oryzias melastigma]|uniref:Uncharacterized protein n=1 Tax=Oryzias melastigma TaxID=30732 RepID=A0A834FHQ5_ORYME|nr:hypothetical protein FQA47_010075 [Oryzias melastigma]